MRRTIKGRKNVSMKSSENSGCGTKGVSVKLVYLICPPPMSLVWLEVAACYLTSGYRPHPSLLWTTRLRCLRCEFPVKTTNRSHRLVA